MNKIKLLTAIDLLKFLKGCGFGENRTTLTRYQSAGIIMLPHQFSLKDLLNNDIPDIRVKFYHPVSVIEFIVNTILLRGYWLKWGSEAHITRPIQSDIFIGRIASLSDNDFVKKYDDKFIEYGIGSFQSFWFSLDSEPFFQGPLVSNSAQCLDVDREINIEDCKNGKCNEDIMKVFYQLEQMKMLNRLVAEGKEKSLSCTKACVETGLQFTLEQLTYSLSFSVFHSLYDTRKYMDYLKMIYSRTFEQVIDDYLPDILQGVDFKEFNVNFFTGIRK